MSDGLGFEVNVGVNDEATPYLAELPGIVEQTVGRVNDALSTLGAGDPWARVISQSEIATMSLNEVTAAAERTQLALRAASQAQNLSGGIVTGLRLPGGDTTSLDQVLQQNAQLIQRRNELLAEQRRVQQIQSIARPAPTREPWDSNSQYDQRLRQLGFEGPMRQGPPLLTVDESSRLRALEREVQQQALQDQVQRERVRLEAGAGGGGRGGIFGSFASGFGGGSDGGQGLNDLAQQAGYLGRYVAIFAIFREITKAIKESVDQTTAFERSVTDLGNRLQISRNEATGLANSMALVGAQAGLSPSETVQYGASYAGVFAGQGSPQSLARQGAGIAAQVQVLTGNVKESLPDLISVINAFNLGVGDSQRVLDAATSAAQNYGLANASAVLPGLAQIGDLAKQSGFSLEQTANAIADIQTRTNDSSQAVAGELQRFLGREGTPMFQKVFASMGINTNQTFDQEISQLSANFDKLSNSQKSFIVSEFGGGRAGVAALAFIEDYNKIVGNTTKSLNEGGIATQQYQNRLNDIVGALKSVSGEFKNLLKDIGTTGIGSGLGVAVEAAKPLIQLLDEGVRLMNELTTLGGHFTLGRDIGISALELAGVIRLIAGANIGSRVGNIVTGLRTRVGNIGRDTAAASEAAGEEKAAAASTALSIELNQLTASVVAMREAVEAEIVSLEAQEAAQIEMTAALEAGVMGTVTAGFSRLGAGIAGIAGMSVGAGGITTGLIVDAIVAQQMYNAESKIGPAIRNAQERNQFAFASGSSADALQTSAQQLREAATKATTASGGLIGTIEGGIGAAEGRIGFLTKYIPFIGGPLSNVNPETTGDVASRAHVIANFQQLEAQRAQAAARQAAQSGDYSSQIDLTKTGGVDASLKALAAEGVSASGQLGALIEKLHDFAEASSGAANFLAKGSAVLVAQNLANAASQNLLFAAATYVAGGTANSAEKRINSKGFISKLAPGLNQAIDEAANAFLNPLQGTAVTPGQEKDLEKKVQDAMVAYLKKNGFSDKDIAKLLPDLHMAAGSAVAETVADMNALHGQKISADAIGGVVADLPNLLQGVQQRTTLMAQLGRIANPHGAQEAGIQAALADARKAYDALKASGATKDQLQPIADEISALELASNNAVIADLQAQQAITEAAIPSENTTQLLKQQIADNNKALSKLPKGDRSDRQPLLARGNQLAQSELDSELADRAASLGYRDDPRDLAKLAKDAVDQAKLTLHNYQTRGITGKALYDAIKAVKQSELAQTQADLDVSNARNDASARIGDTVSQAQQSLKDAEANLAADLYGTKKYYDDLIAVHQQELALGQDLAAQTKRNLLLRGDTTDPVEQAVATLAEAQSKLAYDKAHKVGDLGADTIAVEEASQALQKSQFDQQLSLQQNAYQLHRESAGQYLQFLQSQDSAIRHQLAGMKKGQEGYQQLVDELNTIDQAILSLNNQVSGQFNLGNIKVPSIYEVRRQIASSQAQIIDASSTNNNVTINGVDIGVVIKYINSIIGAGAAGSRAPATTRKAA